MIIGIAGSLGSGKNTVADYLISKGFQHISLSDIIRNEAKKRYLDLSRDSLRILGNNLARKNGSDALAKMAMAAKKKKNFTISSIRKPGEVKYLKKIKNFKLLFVDASIKIRWQRIRKRSRVGESKISFKNFQKQEQIEISGKSSQRLDFCRKEADIIIDNSKNRLQLYRQIKKIIEDE